VNLRGAGIPPTLAFASVKLDTITVLLGVEFGRISLGRIKCACL